MSVHDVLTEENERWEPFGNDENAGAHSLNGLPYPKWWPSTKCGSRGNNRLEMLYGFPFLSYWAIESGQFPKLPPIQLDKFRVPSQNIFSTMKELELLERKWTEASSDSFRGSWKEHIGDPGADFWDKNRLAWESYLIENCYYQLQFFGVPYKGKEKSVFTQNSMFFKNALGYCPGKWILMVNLSLMIVIMRQFRSSGAGPFFEWVSKPWEGRTELLTSEKSIINFPVVDLIRTGDIPRFKILLKQFMGDSVFFKSDFELRQENPNFWDTNKLSILLCFRDFYLSGGFTDLSKKDVYYILGDDNFRILYANMWRQTIINPNGPVARSLNQLSSAFNIGRGWNKVPFPQDISTNYVSSCDFMLCSLMSLYLDLMSSESTAIKFKNAPVNQNHYRGIITNSFNELPNVRNNISDYERRMAEKLEKSKSNNPSSEVASGIVRTGIKDIDTVIPEKSGITKPVSGSFEDLKDQQNVSEDGKGIPPPIEMNISSLQMQSWLNNFRIAWRKTAMYHFLGMGNPIWPMKISNEKMIVTTEEQVIIDFIQKYPPRALRIPKLEIFKFKFNRLDEEWDNLFEDQYLKYLQWVILNVKAEGKENYVEPGCQLKNSKGEDVFALDETGKKVNVLNTLIYFVRTAWSF